METQNASTTPSESNLLQNVNTVRWEYRKITTQPGKIDYRKSEVIAFVVNAGMNVIANNFYIWIKERSFFCLKYLLCWTRILLDTSTFSNSGLSMMDISSRYLSTVQMGWAQFVQLSGIMSGLAYSWYEISKSFRTCSHFPVTLKIWLVIPMR